MRTRTVRDAVIALPGDDPDDLEPLTHTPRPGDRVTDRTITGSQWSRATITDTVISHSWFTAADLNSATFTRITLDRCVLTGCTLMGSQWDTATLNNVVFDDCRLDYSTITRLTTAGPVAFLNCSFTEASITDSTLTKAVLDHCRLDQLELERCDLRGADLRGNELRGLATTASLRGIRVDQAQLPALTDLLVRELSITVAGTR
jgi:uncharacterized protein YjbI with pentapeptide repeats